MSTLKQFIVEEARRLGFVLAGVTTPELPPHVSAFEDWLAHGRHASMYYLATERARLRRRNPQLILPGCKSILVLAVPYSRPAMPANVGRDGGDSLDARGRGIKHGQVAAYAWGEDYHEILPPRLQAIVKFIEAQVGHPIANRWVTDTGPILERDLAQRAGLGWIGKNTCLINPQHGSYFLLAEIFLGLELEPDATFTTDQCGTCTRCIDACPTSCILPNRTLEAGRCISYLTIELKDDIPAELRSELGNWVFGCDVCQAVCPWNRFAAAEGDPAFMGQPESRQPRIIRELELAPQDFNRKFKVSPIRRAKRRGYLRNLAVALGNIGSSDDIPALERSLDDPDPSVQRHAAWAIEAIRARPNADR